jgi:hypothetical protein
VGGTILQWLVPFALAAYFFLQRQTTAFVFSLFFFFENWLYTATYMADARAQVLPLGSTIGGGEGAVPDKIEQSPVIGKDEAIVGVAAKVCRGWDELFLGRSERRKQCLGCGV